jgi:hypothetical protein
MATPRTPNIKQQRQGRQAVYKPPRAAKAWRQQGRTAIVVPQDKPQMAISMLQQTEMFTRTPGAAGTKPRELQNLHQAIRVLQQLILPLRAATVDNKKAVGRLPGAEEAVGAGNRDNLALEVQQVAAGAVVGKTHILI